MEWAARRRRIEAGEVDVGKMCNLFKYLFANFRTVSDFWARNQLVWYWNLAQSGGTKEDCRGRGQRWSHNWGLPCNVMQSRPQSMWSHNWGQLYYTMQSRSSHNWTSHAKTEPYCNFWREIFSSSSYVNSKVGYSTKSPWAQRPQAPKTVTLQKLQYGSVFVWEVQLWLDLDCIV